MDFGIPDIAKVAAFIIARRHDGVQVAEEECLKRFGKSHEGVR
jgi:hypothetical protein